MDPRAAGGAPGPRARQGFHPARAQLAGRHLHRPLAHCRAAAAGLGATSLTRSYTPNRAPQRTVLVIPLRRRACRLLPRLMDMKRLLLPPEHATSRVGSPSTASHASPKVPWSVPPERGCSRSTAGSRRSHPCSSGRCRQSSPTAGPSTVDLAATLWHHSDTRMALTVLDPDLFVGATRLEQLRRAMQRRPAPSRRPHSSCGRIVGSDSGCLARSAWVSSDAAKSTSPRTPCSSPSPSPCGPHMPSGSAPSPRPSGTSDSRHGSPRFASRYAALFLEDVRTKVSQRERFKFPR